MSDIAARLTAALADRYRVERPLGEGGMALVFLATDLKLGRQVAIKVLRPELAASIGSDRFLHEIELTARLQHPQILPLHEAGNAEEFLYYVMPFVEGESLRDRLVRDNKIPIAEAIRIADDVAAALGYAHEHDVVHRDIKPENILLTGGRAVVADFGIARAVRVAGGEKLTATGMAVGTPAYMSPEQAMGAEAIDARTDIYALGCVLYEMVSGAAPFEARTPQALVWKHAAEPVPPLRTKNASVPLFLERAVEQALAKEPEERFQTAAAFGEALTSETVVSTSRHRRQRRQRLGGLLVAVAAVIAGWLVVVGGETTRIESLAVLVPINPTGSPDQEPMLQGMYNAILNELGRAGVPVVGGLRSMMRYRDSDATVREIARELGVDAIVEPSIFWAGDSVGIGIRLIDGESEAQLWAQSYEADSRDMMTLYRQMTRAIAAELKVALTPEIERHLAEKRPVDPEALEAYLNGKFYSAKLTKPDVDKAIDYFNLALEKEPDFALAHAGLSWAWISHRQMGSLPPSVATPLAIDAAERALALDSLLPEGHRAYAVAEGWGYWNWELTERGERRAIALNPRDGDVRAHYSHTLLVLKRWEESQAQLDSALAIDPFNVKFEAFRGVMYTMTGDYEKAVEAFDQVLRTTPNHPVALQVLVRAYHELGRYEDATEALSTLYVAVGMSELASHLRKTAAADGYRAAMHAVGDQLANIAENVFLSPMMVAMPYALAGARDETLFWLEQGVEGHDPITPFIGVFPEMVFLHDEPRFQALLVEMNLPWAVRR